VADLVAVMQMINQEPTHIKVCRCLSNKTFAMAITFVECRYKKVKKELARLCKSRPKPERMYTTQNKGQLIRIDGT